MSSATVMNRRRRQNPDPATDQRCCCNRLHVTTGSLWVGVAEAGLLVLNAAAALITYTVSAPARSPFASERARMPQPMVGGGGAGYLVCSVLGALFGIAVVVVMAFGILRENSLLLLPHLLAQGFYVILSLLGIVGLVILMGLGSVPLPAGLALIAFLLLGVLLELWFLGVVFAAYQHLAQAPPPPPLTTSYRPGDPVGEELEAKAKESETVALKEAGGEDENRDEEEQITEVREVEI